MKRILDGLIIAGLAILPSPAWAIDSATAEYAASLTYIAIGLAVVLSLTLAIGTFVMVAALQKRIKELEEKEAKIEERLSRIEIRDEERRRVDAESRQH